jgi:type I restriction enzyme M protein
VKSPSGSTASPTKSSSPGKASLDIFWPRDESLEDTDDNLPAPGVVGAEIVEDRQAALDEFNALAESLPGLAPGLAASEHAQS